MQLNSPSVSHKKQKIHCYTVWKKKIAYLRVVRLKRLDCLDKEGKGDAGFSIASLRVYSDISGWVKLKFLKQFLPLPPLSLAREGEPQRKQLPGSRSLYSRLLNLH